MTLDILVVKLQVYQLPRGLSRLTAVADPTGVHSIDLKAAEIQGGGGKLAPSKPAQVAGALKHYDKVWWSFVVRKQCISCFFA